MKIRTLCFIVIPLVLLGCGSYHYISSQRDKFQTSKMPKKDSEKIKKSDKLNGRKR